MDDYQMMVDAYKDAGGEDVFADSDVAHLVLERDKVLGAHEVDGLNVDAEKTEAGRVKVNIVIKEGNVIEKPVHMCFGVLPQEGVQKIDMNIEVEAEASVKIMADCVFPNAVKVQHIMDAQIHVAEGGSYIYEENHFHGEDGGVEVIATANIEMDTDSTLKTLFTLREGRVGKIDFDYEAAMGAHSTVEMLARISGYGDDKIKIREAGQLNGTGARGLLDTKIAIREQAEADIYNELIARAADAKGHVDCTEIIKDEAVARAVPIVEVRHPQAKVTHEAAIGSVDNTQLQTLMARGLKEEEAAEVIIQGLLNG